MSFEYYYPAFMFVRESPVTLRMTIAEDDTLMYHLIFVHEKECGNYIRLLHHFALETKEADLSIEDQGHLIKDFIHTNPLEYEYTLVITE